MRILVACHNTFAVGGLEAYLREVIPHLRNLGHDVSVLVLSRDEAGTNGTIPPGTPWMSGVGLSIPELIRSVAAWAPDVIYSHGLGDPARESALASQFPTVLYSHNYGGTCISGNKYRAFPGTSPCTKALDSGCLAIYFPRRCGGLNPVTAVQRYRRERRRQRTFKQYRAVLVASRHMSAELIRNEAPADRVHLVPLFPPGVSPDLTAPVPKPRSGRVLLVGRIVALKGWSHILDALPRAVAKLGRPLTLVVAGDGPDKGAFEVAVRRVGVKVEFLGWVEADRRNAEMRAAELLAVPSIWPEPFGLIGIEAGCVGTPAVGYAVGGITDWLIQGISGESAPGARPDPKQLADALVRALAEPSHWQRLRVGAWETARRFSLAAHLDHLIPILEEAAS